MTDRSLLVVEDDDDIRDLLTTFLQREGFSVRSAGDAAEMDRSLAEATPDLVVLDLMLPGEDGLSICRRLRAAGPMPILMLTARNAAVDRIVGLEMGADDYLGKPFEPRELLARIRALFRRIDAERAIAGDGRALLFEGFRLDLDARTLAVATDGPASSTSVSLTSAEFDLLVCLVERPGRVLSRDQLLDWTRGRIADPLDRTIDVSISRLRRKLAEARPGADRLIATIRNGGYQFTAKVTRS
ncbi:MAG: response regulator [Hyphomicrobiales bacterium]|nr:response regulator [Hyphomicrobiales bacterium]